MDDIRNLLDSGENELTELHGDGTYGAGDFRSKECLELLDEADIVVTNPPSACSASMWRRSWNMARNSSSWQHQCHHLQGNLPADPGCRLWPGFSFNKAMEFAMPEEYESKTGERDKYGRKISKVPRHRLVTPTWTSTSATRTLILYRRYADDPSKYPHYDNYDAIEVSKVKDIPEDYWGVMGVPITFMDKYNPEQFELVGCSYNYGRPKEWPEDTDMAPTVGGKNSTSACSSAVAPDTMVPSLGGSITLPPGPTALTACAARKSKKPGGFFITSFRRGPFSSDRTFRLSHILDDVPHRLIPVRGVVAEHFWMMEPAAIHR